jgi:kinesin family member 15
MSNNIKVFVRVRPQIERETSSTCLSVDEKSLIISTNSKEEREFTYDAVFNENSTQCEVFDFVGKELTTDCLEGFNTTIFAYGQTGSGKTYTVIGENDGSTSSSSSSTTSHEKAGLVPRVLEQLFSQIEKLQNSTNSDDNDTSTVQFICKASICEIYNEKVYDLTTATNPEKRSDLQVRENLTRGVYIDGLSEHSIKNANEAMDLLNSGLEHRKVASTAMNEESSRSHSLFTLYVESIEKCNGLTRSKHSRFNLVDLAGSERQKSTKSSGDRLKEASSINQSLSALGNVIKSLVDIGLGKQRHVHYRDSKLTFLLKDSLGGNSKTSIVANVSPDHFSMNETLSTLKFAQRAKLITNKARVNEDTTGRTVHQLREEIKLLKEQLIMKNDKISSNSTTSSNSSSNSPSATTTSTVSSISTERSLKESLSREIDLKIQIDWQNDRINELKSLITSLDASRNEQKLAYKLKSSSLDALKKNSKTKHSIIKVDESNEVIADLRVELSNAKVAASEWRVKTSILEDQLRSFGMFEEENEDDLETMRKAPFVWLGWKSNALGWQGFQNHESNNNDTRYHIDTLVNTVQELLTEKEELREQVNNQQMELAMTLSMASTTAADTTNDATNTANKSNSGELREQLAATREQNAQLSMLLEDLQVRYSTTERLLVEMEKQLKEEKQNNQNQNEKQKSIYENHIQELIFNCDKMKKECYTTNEDIKILKNTNNTIKENEKQLQIELKAVKNENKNLLENVSTLNNNLNEKNDIIENITNKMNELIVSKQQIEFNMCNMQEDVDNLNCLHDSLEKEKNRLKIDLNNSVTLNEDIANELELTTKDYMASKKNIDALNKEINQLKENIRLNEEHSKDKDDIHLNKMSVINNEISNIKNELTNERDSKQSIMMELSRSIARVGALEGELEVNKVKHSDEMIQLSSVSKSIERELTNKTNELNDIKNDYMMNEKKYLYNYDQINEELIQLKKDMAIASTTNNNELNLYKNTMNDVIKEKNDEIEVLSEQLVNMKKKVLQLEKISGTHSETKKQLDVLVLQNASLETTLDARNNEITKINSEMKQMEAAISSMESETAAAHAYTSETANAAKAAATAALAEGDKLRTVVDALNHLVEDKEKELKSVQEEYSTTITNMELKHNDEILRLKDEKTMTLRNFGQIKSELLEYQNKFKDVTSKLNDVTSKFNDATAKLAAHNNHKQKIKMHEKLKDENNNLREDKSQLQIQLDISKKEIDRLKSIQDTSPRKRIPFSERSDNVQQGMGLMIGELKNKLKSKKTATNGSNAATNNILMSRPVLAKKKRKKQSILRPFQDDDISETW